MTMGWEWTPTFFVSLFFLRRLAARAAGTPLATTRVWAAAAVAPWGADEALGAALCSMA